LSINEPISIFVCNAWRRTTRGDVKPVGGGVSEMRIDYGPGYRLYFVERDKTVVILLRGGDNHAQTRDIKRAIEIAREV
jgi:putative addiction module killer protein